MALYLPRMRSGEGLDPDPAARIGEMNEKSRSNCGTLSLTGFAVPGFTRILSKYFESSFIGTDYGGPADHKQPLGK